MWQKKQMIVRWCEREIARKEKSRFVNGEKVRLWIENEMIHTQRSLVIAEEEIEILERFT